MTRDAADPEQARAFWLAEPGRGEIRTEPLPPVSPGQVRVRALASGVSRGTETIVFSGRVPASQYDAMRAPFQAGSFPAPVKYGYCSVGVIEAHAGDGRREVGQRVFCLHPHQDHYVVPADAVVDVPDAVPTERAILAANMETALNGLWDAGPRIGDRIAVVGAGVVGGLTAALAARIPGTRLQIVDIDERRVDLARALGVDFALPDRARGECDLVLHASGQPAGLRTALGLAGVEAKVVEMSWYGDTDVPLPLGAEFHARRLRLVSSQVGDVAVARRARRSRRDRLALALRLLTEPVFDHFLDAECELSELPDVMAGLASAPDGVLCQRVRYD